MTTEKLNTKWISPEIICSYPNLAEPASEQFGGKFGLSIPLPKSNEEAIAKLQDVVSNAIENKWGAKYRESKAVKKFIEDCDQIPKYEGDEVYANCIKFSAKSKRRPGLLYPDAKTQVEESKIEDVFYPGAIIRVVVQAYATDTGGSMTVAFGLTGVMFVKDGNRIGGASNPSDDFADFADNSFVNDPFTSKDPESTGSDLF